MKKKSIIIKAVISIILVLFMLPSFGKRLKTEHNNKTVVVALNFNSYSKFLSEKELKRSFAENKKSGVNTVLVSEDAANSLSESGFITAAKYKDICHKIDAESTEIENLLKNDKIHEDSYVFITTDESAKSFLSEWIPAKYNEEDYDFTKTSSGAYVYAIYDENVTDWQLLVGFDRQKLDFTKESGMDIALSMNVGAYKNTDYVKILDEIIKEYNVKYLNLKKNTKFTLDTTKTAKENYKALSKLIKDNNLTLILTEEETQLSNQKPIGYADFIKSANGKVLRSYDTFDYLKNADTATDYEQRYQKIINSVVDRNIRFVNILMLSNGNDGFLEKDEKTTLATKNAIEKLHEFGFTTQEGESSLGNYSVNRRLLSVCAMLLMILMWLVVIEILMGREFKWLTILAIIGAVLGALFTFVAPEGIILLYPSLYAITAPCFTITLVFRFITSKGEKWDLLPSTLGAIFLALLLFLITGIVQSALLSGADYYLNSIIFRGIKLSLIVPILFSVVAYFIIKSQKENKNIIKATIDLLNTNIKVYWVVLGVILGAVGLIYIIRSGNVKEISGAESAMRNTITNLMAARPRTKEFLIGWPCLILFVYYVNKTNYEVFKFLFALGSSILFASVTNTFCHVFTDAATIYMRVINGFALGVLVSAVFCVLNIIFLTILKYIEKKGANE